MTAFCGQLTKASFKGTFSVLPGGLFLKSHLNAKIKRRHSQNMERFHLKINIPHGLCVCLHLSETLRRL